jgi:4-amino-4-deoxy-L-arabinose transferase-like glycosyltransferase
VTALVFLVLSTKTRTRNEIYLYLFYLATAIAGLAKGLIGALQPGYVILVYLLLSREWRMLTDVALARGLLIAVSVFAPWWHAMVLKHGAAFWNELVGTEQVRRLTVGEQKQAKGSWEYYIRQLGYALFPWVAFVPGALARAFGLGRTSSSTGRERALLFCYVWALATLLLFTLTLTKYHHYILPTVPPLAIIIGVYLDDLLAKRTRGVLLALLAAVATLAIIAVDLYLQPANWVWMFTYLYTANWARGAPEGLPILIYSLLFLGGLLLAFWSRVRHWAVYALLALSLGAGGYVLNTYQSHCAYHWGQKYVLQTYYKLRKGPQEQLVAWQFNWRGETWYTAAQVVVSKSLKNEAIQKWLRERQGRRFFFITERSRYPRLRSMLPTAKGRETLRIVDDSNVHFVLAEATI